MKTPKYLVSTDHKAGFNFKDIIKGLESKDVLQAMAEVTNLIEDEENLYCTVIFERIPKTNEYKEILRTDDKHSFVVSSSPVHIIRTHYKTGDIFSFISNK